MENLLLVIGFAILSLLAILLINNLSNQKKIKRLAEKNLKEIDDSKYYELKYRIQLLISVSTIILVVGGFLGINTIRSLKNDLSNKIEVKSAFFEANILELEKKTAHLNSSIEVVNSSIMDANKELADIKRRQSNIIETFIIKDILIEYEFGKPQKIYFKDLITIHGHKLPPFKRPPLINVIESNQGSIAIGEKTDEYFEISLYMSLMAESHEYKVDKLKFSISIIKY